MAAGNERPAEEVPKSADAVGSRTVASAAIFTAFVAAATMLFTLAIPATPSGYFNFGEVMVYICAFLMGPYVGAFAGGVGSSIADVALASANYAPGTLLIKGAEGLIVGYLSSRLRSVQSATYWRASSVGAGAFVGALLGVLGSTYYSGSYEFTLGIPDGPQQTFLFSVPWTAWIALGLLVFAAASAIGLLTDERVGWPVMSALAGGSVMFTGYFLYNYAVLGIGFAASAGEVPFDVGQALIGLVIAVPVALRVQRIGGGRRGQGVNHAA